MKTTTLIVALGAAAALVQIPRLILIGTEGSGLVTVSIGVVSVALVLVQLGVLIAVLNGERN